MARRKKSNYDASKHEIYVIATARQTSKGYTQEQIAEHLGLRQPLVSRLYNEAKETECLGKHFPFNPKAKGLTEEKIAEADNLWISDLPLAERLEKLQMRKAPLKLAVFPSGRTEFARGAAYY